MTSFMVVGTIRKMFGYYDFSINDRFTRVIGYFVRDLFVSDVNNFSGIKEVVLSFLFIKKIFEFEIVFRFKGSFLTVSIRFDYGFGRFFKRSNFRITNGCRSLEFYKGLNVNCFRRVGLVC